LAAGLVNAQMYPLKESKQIGAACKRVVKQLNQDLENQLTGRVILFTLNLTSNLAEESFINLKEGI
jgi:hypothetical protein